MADVAQCVANCLAGGTGKGAIPPRPPSSLQVDELTNLALRIIDQNPAIRTWMSAVDLDPQVEQDALLAMGLIIAVPRREPIYEASPSA